MLHQIIAATFTTNQSVCSAIYIGDAKHVALEVATFANGLITATANLYFQVAKNATDTFRRVQAQGVYSGNSGIYDLEIPSTIGNKIFILDALAGFDYMKVETSKTATATLAMNVHVWR